MQFHDLLSDIGSQVCVCVCVCLLMLNYLFSLKERKNLMSKGVGK